MTDDLLVVAGLFVLLAVIAAVTLAVYSVRQLRDQ